MLKALALVLATAVRGYTPGCALAVLHNDVVAYEGARGYADLDYGVPLSSNSVFYIASDSKQFTAFCIALLVDRGVLNLNDPVTKWIPELPADVYGGVTIAELVHHISGVRDYWGLLDLQGVPSSAPLSQADFLQLMAAQKALNFAAGDRFEYSNSGYALLGIVVGRASGKALPAFAAEKIFKPLRMAHTSYGADHLLPLHDRAIGYQAVDASFRMDSSAFEPLGDGGVRTTTGDMMLWLKNLDRNALGDHPAHVAALIRSTATRKGGATVPYAFGFGISSRNGYATLDHTGEYGGYESFVAWLPQLRLGVVTLCNVEHAPFSAWSVGLDVVDLYAGPHSAATPSPGPAAAAVTLDSSTLARIAGTYTEPDGTVWRFAVKANNLEAHVQGLTFPFAAIDRTHLRGVGAPAPLEIAIEGPELSLTVGGGAKEVLHRLIPPELTAASIAAYSGTYHSDELNVTFRVYGEDGKLFIARDLEPVRSLEPVQLDAFVFAGRNLTFHRNGEHAIDGIVLSASGVDDLVVSKTTR